MRENQKCVFIISDDLPIGRAMNCCSLLAVNLGASNPEIVGSAAVDADGGVHSGLCSIPIPVLKAPQEMLGALKAIVDMTDGCTAYDITSISQKARKYSDVLEWTKETKATQMQYVGLGILGPKDRVNEMTASLELYR